MKDRLIAAALLAGLLLVLHVLRFTASWTSVVEGTGFGLAAAAGMFRLDRIHFRTHRTVGDVLTEQEASK